MNKLHFFLNYKKLTMNNDYEKIILEAKKVKESLELLLKICEIYRTMIEYAEFDHQDDFPILDVVFYSEMDRITFMEENKWLRRVKKLSINSFKKEPKILFSHSPF
jgi:hypothetical protein